MQPLFIACHDVMTIIVVKNGKARNVHTFAYITFYVMLYICNIVFILTNNLC